jgi:hypothetical protein
MMILLWVQYGCVEPISECQKKFFERARAGSRWDAKHNKKVRKIKSPTFLQVSWDPMLGFDINIRDSLKQNSAFNKRGDKG